MTVILILFLFLATMFARIGYRLLSLTCGILATASLFVTTVAPIWFIIACSVCLMIFANVSSKKY